mgnify:FL=1
MAKNQISTKPVRLWPMIAKIIIMALVASGLGYMMYVAFLAGENLIGGVLAAVLIASFVVYGSKGLVPLKFLLPGIILLAVFVVTPPCPL